MGQELGSDGIRREGVFLEDGAGDTADEQGGKEIIVAIIQTSRAVKEADRLRIRNWLQVRLGVDEVDVIVNSDRK